MRREGCDQGTWWGGGKICKLLPRWITVIRAGGVQGDSLHVGPTYLVHVAAVGVTRTEAAMVLNINNDSSDSTYWELQMFHCCTRCTIVVVMTLACTCK